MASEPRTSIEDHFLQPREDGDGAIGVPPPKAYAGVRVVKPAPAPPIHDFTPHLGELKRMSKQGMGVAQIAARLGFPTVVLDEHIALYLDVRQALIGGRALGIDEVTEKNYKRAVEDGDMQAIKMYLAQNAGWAPTGLPSTSLTVNVNQGSAPAVVDASHVSTLAERHTNLLDLAASGGLEGFTIDVTPSAPSAPSARIDRLSVEQAAREIAEEAAIDIESDETIDGEALALELERLMRTSGA